MECIKILRQRATRLQLGVATFPFLAVHFPVIANRLPCYLLWANGQEIPAKSAPAKHEVRLSMREMEISLYFSLFFAAETGSPQTASSASQSGLCGPVSRSVRSSGISAG